MSTQLHVAATAAFMATGLHKQSSTSTLEQWGEGYLELIYELTQYAEYLTKMHDAGYSLVGSEGTFAYEVSVPFGSWFANYIDGHNGNAPTKGVAMMNAVNRSMDFFSQGLTHEEILDLKEVLLSITIDGD